MNKRFELCWALLFFMVWTIQSSSALAQITEGKLAESQTRMVKIYGSGGFANLHAYQSGIYVDKSGAILTVWSHVLDGKIIVVDNFGNRSIARFVGMDPETELALLQTDNASTSFFNLASDTKVTTGTTIYSICNLFGIASQNEQQSVMSGVVSGKTMLDGKSGNFETTYAGEVITVDLIVNNPGAAGGAIINSKGELVGLIGKELKDKQTGLWLNFCMPAKIIRESVNRIRSGSASRPLTRNKVVEPFRWQDVGLQWIPQVLKTTRPFVDRVKKDSVADKLGFEPDDLLVFVNNEPIRTLEELNKVIQSIDRDQSFRVTLRRGNKLITKIVSRVKQ